MKKLLLITLLFVVTLSRAEEKAVTEINECFTDIYFGNGILTTRDEAGWDKKDLSDRYHIAKYGGLGKAEIEKAKKEINFDLAYNYSFKETWGDGIGAIFDLMESYQQLDDTDYGWKTFNVLVGLANELAVKKNPIGAVTKKLIKDYLVKFFINDALAEFMSIHLSAGDLAKLKQIGFSGIKIATEAIHDEDLQTQVDSYKWSIKSGHGVVVVSHSQGNLFALQAYAKLEKEDDWMLPYFHQVSIASPATKTVKDVDHITFNNDAITVVIRGLEGDFPNPLRYWTWIRLVDLIEYEDRENITLPPEDYPIFNGSGCVDEKLLIGVEPSCKTYDGTPFKQNEFVARDSLSEDFHAFSYYMKEETSRNNIFEMIDNRRELYKNEESQWITDQETNKNTCEHKITVKHRYDPSIEIPLDVYPFNASKKLYQVNGEWVKASCGGENILGEGHDIITWDGKKDNECLMIDNVEEEKIEAKQIIKFYAYYYFSMNYDIPAWSPYYYDKAEVKIKTYLNEVTSFEEYIDNYYDLECVITDFVHYGDSVWFYNNPLTYIDLVENSVLVVPFNIFSIYGNTINCLFQKLKMDTNSITKVIKEKIYDSTRMETVIYGGEIEKVNIKEYFIEYSVHANPL